MDRAKIAVTAAAILLLTAPAAFAQGGNSIDAEGSGASGITGGGSGAASTGSSSGTGSSGSATGGTSGGNTNRT